MFTRDFLIGLGIGLSIAVVALIVVSIQRRLAKSVAAPAVIMRLSNVAARSS